MPTIQTIPAGNCFVDALASGLLEEAGGDPEALADGLILLPNRRACRALREGFLRVAGGRPLLLPEMRPLGEIDEEALFLAEAPGIPSIELPAAVPTLRRTLILAGLIRELAPEEDAVSADQATRLAAELARLLDRVQTERLDFDGLANLAPEQFAAHWQQTLEFLRIVTNHWPKRLAMEEALDPADRRNRLLEGQAAAWQRDPPDRRIVAAGSTGSIPATADLLDTVAHLPRGAVVLPGLDRHMDADSLAAAATDQTHPQHGMLRLLARIGVNPEEVLDWPGLEEPIPAVRARARLVTETMRPAETTEAWRDIEAIPAAALDGVERIDCPNEAVEAETIALVLRDALESEGETAALVTPDRNLARRVATALRRWSIDVDDSAGRPLAETPATVFFRLLVEMVALRFSPVATLAVLKHPLATLGMTRDALRGAARSLERNLLRGPRPGAGLAGLRAAMPESLASTEKSRIAALLDALEATTAGLSEALSESRPPLAALLDAHIRSAEAAAETDGEGGLWLGEDGEALAEFLDEARAAADALPAVETDSYPALFTALLAGRVVRPRFGRHPRLHIWGPLEARLQHADLIVLGGLNEGNWPRDPDPDPWLSRPMQVQFGLPPPERRIGLAAHDFASALAAPRVVLTRAEKSEGAPSVPSRWLSRLDAVLRAGDDHPRLETTGQWLAWQAALDRPDRPRRVSPPAPRPPIEVRPRALSVTQIESWMRDPYSIFARHILKLRPLEPLEADPAAADRGNIIHAALDRFVAAFPDALPADAEDRLREIGQTAFADALAHPVVHAFWWPRFERVADWFVAVERERRPRLAHSATERRGTLTIEAPGGPFLLSAHADRIDRLLAGGYAVLDYKTGAPPPPRELLEGHAPQLPLEAAIARAGGFEGLAAAPVESLAFWRLSGGATAGEIKEVDEDIEALASAALEGLRELVTAFDDPAVSYAAAPDAARAPRFNDYAHLARLLEWAGFPEDEATP